MISTKLSTLLKTSGIVRYLGQKLNSLLDM